MPIPRLLAHLWNWHSLSSPSRARRGRRPKSLCAQIRTSYGNEQLEARLLLDSSLPLAVSVLTDAGLVALTDRAYELGQVDYRSTVERRFVVTNLGTSVVELSRRVTLPPDFSLTAEPTSLTLAPNESSILALACEPLTMGAIGGAVTLYDTSDAPVTFSFTIDGQSSWDPADDLQLFSAANVLELRQSLIEDIWKRDTLPTALPALIESDVGSPIAELTNLSHVERWTVEMELGLNSLVYWLEPVNNQHRLAVVHQGHGDDLGSLGVAHTVQSLLDSGFTVLTFWMPETGPNNRPFAPHAELAALETAELNPIKFFLEPVVESLNLALSRHAWQDVSMIGVSGGGWTTTLVAALDPRIQNSFPVAGSLPEPLRDAYNQGDYEQVDPLLYDGVHYLELYVLGSSGVQRRQTQILIEDDPVAYSATGLPDYSTAVRDTLRATGGGDYRLFVDRSQHEHQISPWVIDHVLLATLGADPERGASTPLPGPDGTRSDWTLDDDDSAFTAEGDWQRVTDNRGDLVHASSNGSDVAAWQFTNLASGVYDVQMSWGALADAAAAAVVTLFDPSQPTTPLATLELDQRVSSGSPETNWVTLLSGAPLSSGALSVTLSSDGVGWAVADRVRVERRLGLDRSSLDVWYSGTRLADGDPLPFGEVLLGETITRALTLQNVSNHRLTIDKPSTLPPGLEWLSAPLELDPGEAVVVPLQFTARTAGAVSVLAQLDLLPGAAPPLLIRPTAHVQPVALRASGRLRYSEAGTTDFGSAFTDQEQTLAFELTNLSDQWLDLTAGMTPPDGFAVRGALPELLAPGASAPFQVALAAARPGLYDRQLVLAMPGGLGSMSFNLHGRVFDVWTVDNDAPGNSFEGTWTRYTSFGKAGDARLSWPEDGPAVSTWQFGGLPAGSYEVGFTWTDFAVRATNAAATVYDGPYARGTILLNQTLPPGPPDLDGFCWTSFSTAFSIGLGVLTVRLSNVADGPVIADAVRIRPAQPRAAHEHNPLVPLDANGDGEVTPLDVLIVIDRLNQPRLQVQSLPASPAPVVEYSDVNDDGRVSPLDALLIINALNAPPPGEPATAGAVVPVPAAPWVDELPATGLEPVALALALPPDMQPAAMLSKKRGVLAASMHTAVLAAGEVERPLSRDDVGTPAKNDAVDRSTRDFVAVQADSHAPELVVFAASPVDDRLAEEPTTDARSGEV